ncbi:cytosolic phospholipase A2 gamma [Pleurodeles waltl]|uniref:cytosolic phospholipase A2 gamma n=1 Tax=Pleurodeles waltl TaxID=8319 RepID=UPI0037097048
MDKVPCVALLGSGGALRAMIALMGTLCELHNEDLLDSIMYLCGVSGSTWCMSSIYEDINWSKNVQDHESKLKEHRTKPTQNPLSLWEKLKHAFEEEVYSLTVLWSYLIGRHMIKQINENTLSNHKRACENGANPYPIYAAVEKSNLVDNKENSPGTWFEFTPHDAGFPDYGAFIRTEAVGSQFKKGDLSTIKAEQTICYLQGLWGSALADEQKMKTYIRDCIFSWFKGGHENEEKDEAVLEQFDEKCSCERCLAAEFLMGLPIEELESEVGHNALVRLEELLEATSSLNEKTLLIAKLMKCLISWQWGTTHNYLYKCSIKDTPVPKDLAEREYIHLIDAGLAINSGYPLVLRPERKVNLILSFDFSAGDPFETLTRAAAYCIANNIPFPDVTLHKNEEEEPSGCYIFKGPNVPTVMHIPLFNKENCAGEVEKYQSTFSTFQTSYSEDNVEDLLRVSKMNVQKNKSEILKELANAVQASVGHV